MASTLNVTKALQNPGQEFPFEADCVIDEMEVLGDPVLFTDAKASGLIVGASQNLSVTGEATANVVTRCSRCLEEVRFPISAKLDAEFTRQPDPEDPDQYVFEASSIDLTDAIRDALTLELPLRVLCKEDCKGLCPKCGVNLNTGSCSCPKGSGKPNPFEALKSIVENHEEV